jgi:hypothetical protein
MARLNIYFDTQSQNEAPKWGYGPSGQLTAMDRRQLGKDNQKPIQFPNHQRKKNFDINMIVSAVRHLTNSGCLGGALFGPRRTV